MLLLPLVLLALAWIQESLDQFLFGGRWALPLVHGGPFWGVLTAPFSHSDWSHLVSNSLWFLPLSYLVLLNGVRAYVAVWIGVYATAALVWLWLPVASHGLSGVVYGLLGYLLLIGWLGGGRSACLVVGMSARLWRLAAGVAALPQSARRELDWPHLWLCRRLDRGMGCAQVAIALRCCGERVAGGVVQADLRTIDHSALSQASRSVRCCHSSSSSRCFGPSPMHPPVNGSSARNR